ncbi:Inner membrane protein YhaI [compost metagenome]
MISDVLGGIFALATLLPSIAAATRRLHDTNRSGWWQLLCLVPIIGGIVLIVFLAQDSQSDNAFAQV